MIHTQFGAGLRHYGNWLYGPGVFFHDPFGWIITLSFWVLILFLVYKLLQFLFSRGSRTPTNHLDKLKKRYVEGEINEEEYHRMKPEFL